MQQATGRVVGMARASDHETSIAAAEKVAKRRLTIREQVIHFALAKPFGFTDEDLIDAFPNSPESSYRKRRTELSDENIIVARGDESVNRAGQKVIIWTHRDHMLFPPPQKERSQKPARFLGLQEDNARLRAQLADARGDERRLCASYIRRFSEAGDAGVEGYADLNAIANDIERGNHLA